MRRSLVAILAVAIIGALGLYTRAPKPQPVNSAPAPAANSTAVDASSTSVPIAAAPASNPPATTGKYKDGTYNGVREDTIYGPVQVAAVISGGRIVNIKFLQMPSDEGNSREVTSFAEPDLKQSALSKQSAHIDFVSGATQTSEGYERSLQAALDQAV
jgi:uncharacterized protein with FMN-binding domain